MGSVTAFSPSPRFFGTHAYAAAKAAIEGLTTSAAAYYAPRGIRFNVLAPGLTDTPMSRRAMAMRASRTSSGRSSRSTAGAPANPTDLDAAVVFFLSDASRFVTGQVLAVDGGWSVSEGGRGALGPCATRSASTSVGRTSSSWRSRRAARSSTVRPSRRGTKPAALGCAHSRCGAGDGERPREAARAGSAWRSPGLPTPDGQSVAALEGRLAGLVGLVLGRPARDARDRPRPQRRAGGPPGRGLEGRRGRLPRRGPPDPWHGRGRRDPERRPPAARPHRPRGPRRPRLASIPTVRRPPPPTCRAPSRR